MATKAGDGLDLWTTVTQDTAHQASQTPVSTVQWTPGITCRYRLRDDRVAIGRGFAQRWHPLSNEARYILAHELGHRAARHDHESRTTTAMRAPAPLLTIATGLLGAVAPLTSGGIAGASVAVTALVAVLIVALSCTLALALALHRLQPDLHRFEHEADDYATALTAGAGLDVMTTYRTQRGVDR